MSFDRQYCLAPHTFIREDGLMKDQSTNEPVQTDRDNHLWLKLWRDRQTDFHSEKVNKHLMAFWPRLNLVRGSRIFVPLCGKTLDMAWLAMQGHEVVGVELSPVAVKAFFRENKLKPTKRRIGKYTLWKHGRISILCGDYFSLKEADIGRIDTVYDRAALTALPEDIRVRYAAHMQQIVPKANIFLLTVEDIEREETLERGIFIDQEIISLFSSEFIIELAHVESDLGSGNEPANPSATQTEYKVYQLSSKTAQIKD